MIVYGIECLTPLAVIKFRLRQAQYTISGTCAYTVGNNITRSLQITQTKLITKMPQKFTMLANDVHEINNLHGGLKSEINEEVLQCENANKRSTLGFCFLCWMALPDMSSPVDIGCCLHTTVYGYAGAIYI